MTCRCNTLTNTRCQFHARQPKPCPNHCGGHIERISGEAVLPQPRLLRGEGVQWVKRHVVFWACNTCEFTKLD